MHSTARPLVVVAGVSGVGKTTVALAVAHAHAWPFQEGDDLHPEANVERMRSGVPLTDDDRWPWLDRIGAWLDERAGAGEAGVVTCSALRRAYRDRLATGRPDVRFLHLVAPGDVVREHLAHRTGHFMPPALLSSQYDVLEPLGPDEQGADVPVAPTREETVERALAVVAGWLGGHGDL